MNKKYFMCGIWVVVIGLLMYISVASLKVDSVCSNKVESNIDKEVNGVNTEENSIDNKSLDKEGTKGNQEIKDEKEIAKALQIAQRMANRDDKESAVESETSKDDVSSDKEFNEKKAVEEEIMYDEKYDVVEVFDTKISPTLSTNIKYEEYPIGFSYAVILEKSTNIREEPTFESKVLRKTVRNEKINLSKAVKGQYVEKYDSDIWYKVYWEDKGETTYGYMIDKVGEARKFRVNEIEKLLNKLKAELDSNHTAYISNYKNSSGVAPVYKGKSVDKYGTRRNQAAPGYIKPDRESIFRYFPDGVLLSILDEKDEFFKVRTLNFKGAYWVPKKYVSLENSIDKLKKIVVIDRKNQNETVFEYNEDKWTLVSYALATTGQKGKYKSETPLGYYMAIEKRHSFLYYRDGTTKIAGFAPYATRFAGGMYIHGIPVNFKFIEDKRVNPGTRETSSTIGTIPLSHGCVRNNTSHAKFLYDWLNVGESAIIVIDESSNFKDENSNLIRVLEVN